MKELEGKLDQIRRLLGERELDGLLLDRASSFAWATCGASSYINTASSTGAASLLITPSARYLIADNIEAPRLQKEENLAAQGWQLLTKHWYEPKDPAGDLMQGKRLGADGPRPGAADLSGELARMRAALTNEEGDRMRDLGRICAEAMDEAVRRVRPGQSEYDIAGLLAEAAESRGAQAIVNLIATDERIYSYRHPLPTNKTLDRYAMLVLCGRKWGLVCSITRLVYFGQLPGELRSKMEATARVDAAFIAATRPGSTLGDCFQVAVDAYGQEGFPEEWQLHHQGGPAGYEPREYVATPGSEDKVLAGQAYAWNPSITGTKSEDTVLVTSNGHEVLTAIPGWPTLKVSIGGEEIERPLILEA